MKTTDTEKKESIEALKKLIGRNYKVYTSCDHVSASGMTRNISCYIAKGGDIIDITWHVARVLEYKRNRDNGGMVVRGCGMDMGFSVVYNLSCAMYPRTKSGGYKLEQRWM